MYLYALNGYDEGSWFALDKATNQVGRSDSNDIVLAHDGHVSGKHACLTEREGDLWLEDLDSTHGTKVNDRRVTAPCVIQSGDVLCLGETLLMVCESKDRIAIMRMAVLVK